MRPLRSRAPKTWAISNLKPSKMRLRPGAALSKSEFLRITRNLYRRFGISIKGVRKGQMIVGKMVMIAGEGEMMTLLISGR